ncbi:hypothetical protein M9Y10_024277 [Tritrichomonas musculus]|uniref:Uncharacterized protein n=1 Tax=Tritrichomonas musculus TaxID=1915356 RepID=A0ABR2HDC0_9EUKA
MNKYYVQKRIEAAQQQVVSTDAQIKAAEKLTIEKKQSIENLKKEILKVKEEIDHLNYDTTQDDAQAKQCEIEIEKLETQVKQSQQKLEKVSHTVEELQRKLQEMINYRAVLEAELNDMYNREKPEVRKLIEDVRNTKQSTEDAQTKMNQLTKRISSRREELIKLKNSQDKKKNEDLKILKEKLTRRVNKWTKLNSTDSLDLNGLKEFSVSMATQREKAKNDVYKNMRTIWAKEEEVSSLSKYAELLDSMLTEYNKQNTV